MGLCKTRAQNGNFKLKNDDKPINPNKSVEPASNGSCFVRPIQALRKGPAALKPFGAQNWWHTRASWARLLRQRKRTNTFSTAWSKDAAISKEPVPAGVNSISNFGRPHDNQLWRRCKHGIPAVIRANKIGKIHIFSQCLPRVPLLDEAFGQISRFGQWYFDGRLGTVDDLQEKFRSQASDNMDRWKAEMGRVREEKRRKSRRREEKVSEERRSRCAKR